MILKIGVFFVDIKKEDFFLKKYIKRHKMSKKTSKKVFARGVKIKAKNFEPVIRGGTSL